MAGFKDTQHEAGKRISKLQHWFIWLPFTRAPSRDRLMAEIVAGACQQHSILYSVAQLWLVPKMGPRGDG